MTPKLIVVILAISAIPVCAPAQDASPPVAAARKVVGIINSDPAKIAIYCDIDKLGEQIEDATLKNNKKAADALTLKMRELEKQLGPEYVSLMNGLPEPESDDAAKVEATFGPLDRACAKK